MRIVQTLIGATLFLVMLFAGLNWEAFTSQGQLNLLIRHVEGPLGVIMLAVVGLLSAIYGVALSRIQTAAWLESRRNLKELDQARRVANSKEESRIRELEATVQHGFDQVSAQMAVILAKVESAHLDEVGGKEKVARP